MGEQPADQRTLEQRILDAAASGGTVDVTDRPDDERHVDGEFLRGLYLGRHGVDLDPRGPELVGVHVDGGLDLSYGDVRAPIRTRQCRFHGPLHVSDATTRDLQLDAAKLPRLSAFGARVNGQLLMRGTTLTHRGSGDDAALGLDGAHLNGVFLTGGFASAGQIRAVSSRISGSVYVGAATLTYTGPGPAVLLDAAEVHGGTSLGGGLVCAGRISAVGARLGRQLVLGGATLSHAGAEPALNLDGADIAGYLRLDRGFACSGQIRALDVRVGGQVIVSDAAVTHRGTGPDAALVFDRAQIAGDLVLTDGCTCDGEIRAVGARIGGQVMMRRTVLAHSGPGPALELAGAEIAGDLRLDGCRCAGPVRCAGARVGGRLNLRGAVLTHAGVDDDATLILESAQITRDLLLNDGFRSAGQVRAAGAHVGGDLMLRDAALAHPGPDPALVLDGCVVTGALFIGARLACASTIHGVGLQVHGPLVDQPDAWPSGSMLEGFSYAVPVAIDGATWLAGDRVGWLDRMAYSSQAYRFLADRYRQRGMPDAADIVLVAMRKAERSRITGRLPRLRRRLDWLFEKAAGYGYWPERTVGLSLAVVAVTAGLLFLPSMQNHLVTPGPVPGTAWTANGALIDDRPPETSDPNDPDDAVGPPVAEGATDDRTTVRFQPVFYAIDTVVPLVDLDQRSTWTADTTTPAGWALGTYLNVMRLLGWGFAAAITFAVARLFQTRHG